MHIRVGYELIYHCPQATPMILLVNIHYSRVSDIVMPDSLMWHYRLDDFPDGFTCTGTNSIIDYSRSYNPLSPLNSPTSRGSVLSIP